MSEWLKEHAWKACVGETLPWVRIPLSPPILAPRKHACCRDFFGIHVDFRPTGCGQNAFWIGTTGQRTATFDRLVGRAHDYVTLGF